MTQEYKIAYQTGNTVTGKAYRGDPPSEIESRTLDELGSTGVYEKDSSVGLAAGDWIVYLDTSVIIGAETYQPTVLVGGSGNVRSAGYVGDFKLSDKVIYFLWYGNITGGTVSIYKDAGTTQETTGLTDTRDFDGVSGLNLCVVTFDLNKAFLTEESDYHVVLTGGAIDGETLTAFTIAEFSIENRSDGVRFIRQG